MRCKEYQQFLDHISKKRADTLSRNTETAASPQEIGWWKQYQFRRAMRHARNGVATPEELLYLARHGYFYPKTPKYPVGSQRRAIASQWEDDR